MLAPDSVLVSVPASIAMITLLLRFGPPALLTLVAGMIAVLASGERGKRALVVLQLLRRSPVSGSVRTRRMHTDAPSTTAGKDRPHKITCH
ncbi:hypothetical protein KALB_8659 [Kutzneria albida DSM 43870]|uniref:Uncharacterized protein n=1 Tax=Kutzneria albida DSM 43870 TaxID=1449976 RepID=W5WML5_9PSEU|nr:hypothetical protein KALB_8659 [Kutzneria albida DSM 43870]